MNQRAMPDVIQVKNLGLVGYSAKYKGLGKENTTDWSSLMYLGVNMGRRRNHGDGR